jgi:hypothetical protein
MLLRNSLRRINGLISGSRSQAAWHAGSDLSLPGAWRSAILVIDRIGKIVEEKMKRNTILTLVIGLVISLSAIGLWRAGAAVTIDKGYDLFTTPDNAVTNENLSLDQGFFVNAGGSPSKAFSGKMTLKGGASVPGFNADTVIERTAAVTVPGSTPLSLFGLRLVSAAPIHIDFVDGSSADYSISVKESSSTPSTGTLYFNADNTFSSSLQINREYTFTSAGQPTKVLDSAGAGWAAIGLSATGTWQATTSANGNAAIVAGGVVIRPNTEQAQLAAHGIIPAPKPTRTKPIGIEPTPTLTNPNQ